MEDLFISKEGADVTFVVHGQELRAHKLFLIARSPVFKAMIEGPLAPADQRHLIDDPEITFVDFEKFLRFLCTDELQMHRSNVKAFFHLANFYDVPYLLRRCVRHIQTRLMDEENILEFAEIGLLYAPTSSLLEKFPTQSKTNFYDVPYLLRRCVRHIQTRLMDEENILEFAEIGLLYAPTSSLLEVCLNIFFNCMIRENVPLAYHLPDGSLKWISAELALEIVKQHNTWMLNVTEDELFNKVFNWAKTACLHQGQQITPKNIQAIMAPFMPHFECKYLSPTTLATTIKEFKLIPDNQLIESLAGHIAKNYDQYIRLDIFGNSRQNYARGRGGAFRRGGGGDRGPRYEEYYEEREFRNLPPRGGFGRGGFGRRSPSL
uniref:BTB domain-containing protein n=1 Tax=Panagrolaimus sp. ES5 TaxID=591445 RepID=A0AC34FXS3_9BILA